MPPTVVPFAVARAELVDFIDLALRNGLGDAVMLHGPAGCGKTMLARSLASSLSWPVVWLEPLKIMTASARRRDAAEAELAEQLEAACARAPCVLVVDEVDAIASSKAPPRTVESRLANVMALGIDHPEGALLV